MARPRKKVEVVEEVVEEVTEEVVTVVSELEVIAPTPAPTPTSPWIPVPTMSDKHVTAEAVALKGDGKRACFVRFKDAKGNLLGAPQFIDGYIPKKSQGTMQLR